LEDATYEAMEIVDEKQIESLLKKNFLIKGRFKINNGMVSIEGDITVRDECELSQLPVNFENITGNFNLTHNHLTTLYGSPSTVGGGFFCSNGKLTSLQGGPDYVKGGFSCSHNKLTSLQGGPSFVGGGMSCASNPLKSLEGIPISTTRYFGFPYRRDLPLLRVLQYNFAIESISDKSSFSETNTVRDILEKYSNNPSRSNILACQKELINAGFEGNASW
jgi:hypothetical protein